MYEIQCCICNKYVYTVTKNDIREKYKEVIGTILYPDQNLCYICIHLIKKFAMFKTTCLNKCTNLNSLHNQRTSFGFQIHNVNSLTICSETCCDENLPMDDVFDIKLEDSIDDLHENVEQNDSDVESMERNFFDDENSKSKHFIDSTQDDVENTETQNIEKEIIEQNAEIQDSKEIPNKRVKIKKKKKSFERISLSYEEQKTVLEMQRKEKKYTDAIFKCYSCALGFLFKDSYQSHMVRHEESNGQYCCNVCSLRFATQNLKYMHMVLHSEIYKCNKCGKKIKRPHRRRHINECWHGCKNAVSCSLCTKVFKDPNGLQQHLKRFHGSEVTKTYSCNLCGQTCNNQRAVRTHMIKHVNHRFKCDICQSTFASPCTLRRHKKTHTQSDPTYCVTCDKWYKSNRLYREHLAVSMKHRQYRFECPICHRTCPSRRALSTHTATVHTSSKTYVCGCGNRYTTAQALTNHERRHHPRPTSKVLCHQCGNTYSTKSKLQRHLKEVCERIMQQEQ